MRATATDGAPANAETRRVALALVEQLLAILWVLCEHLDAAVDAVTANDVVLRACLDSLQAETAAWHPGVRFIAGAASALAGAASAGAGAHGSASERP